MHFLGAGRGINSCGASREEARVIWRRVEKSCLAGGEEEDKRRDVANSGGDGGATWVNPGCRHGRCHETWSLGLSPSSSRTLEVIVIA